MKSLFIGLLILMCLQVGGIPERQQASMADWSGVHAVHNVSVFEREDMAHIAIYPSETVEERGPVARQAGEVGERRRLVTDEDGNPLLAHAETGLVFTYTGEVAFHTTAGRPVFFNPEADELDEAFTDSLKARFRLIERSINGVDVFTIQGYYTITSLGGWRVADNLGLVRLRANTALNPDNAAHEILVRREVRPHRGLSNAGRWILRALTGNLVNLTEPTVHFINHLGSEIYEEYLDVHTDWRILGAAALNFFGGHVGGLVSAFVTDTANTRFVEFTPWGTLRDLLNEIDYLWTYFIPEGVAINPITGALLRDENGRHIRVAPTRGGHSQLLDILGWPLICSQLARPLWWNHARSRYENHRGEPLYMGANNVLYDRVGEGRIPVKSMITNVLNGDRIYVVRVRVWGLNNICPELSGHVLVPVTLVARRLDPTGPNDFIYFDMNGIPLPEWELLMPENISLEDRFNHWPDEFTRPPGSMPRSFWENLARGVGAALGIVVVVLFIYLIFKLVVVFMPNRGTKISISAEGSVDNDRSTKKTSAKGRDT